MELQDLKVKQDNEALTTCVDASVPTEQTDLLRFASTLCTSGFRERKAQPFVMIAACALAQDAELALILFRALSDIGLASLQAVIANVQPARARARLTRGTLDALGMEAVPVAVGTDGNTKHTDDFTATVADTGFDYLQREPEWDSGEDLLLHTYTKAAPLSLTLLLLSSLTDAAVFIRRHTALFVEKTSCVVIQGGVDTSSLDSSSEFLLLDPSAQNHHYDIEAATYVYQQCQELQVRLVILARFTAYAAGVPAFVFDELATIGHPVALRLRESEIRSATDLWQRCALPEGHEQRLGLPGRCDRAWFARQVCGGQDLSDLAEDVPIWPYVTTVALYDPLCLLAALPATLQRFFVLDTKVVRGVEHIVIGSSEDRNGIRDVPALKSFMMNALRYSLMQSIEQAEEMKAKLAS